MILFKKEKKQAGFTLIETLVAITILMISIAGPLTVAHKGLTSALYARDQMIASYLAQDAIEYIKNFRDNNILAGDASIPWNKGFSGCTKAAPCIVDTYQGTPLPTASVSIGPGGNGIITKSSSNMVLYSMSRGYAHNQTVSGTVKVSPFSRYFYLVPGVAGSSGSDESNLIVVVDWTTNNVANEIKVSSSIFNSLR